MSTLIRLLGVLLALQMGLASAADRGLAAFRDSIDGNVVAATVILKTPAAASVAAQSPAALSSVDRYMLDLWAEQDRFLEQLLLRDLRVLPRVANVRQIDGSTRTVHWRYTYLMNGFTAWVAEEDLARLRAQPEVAAVYREDAEIRYFVDRAVDYVLGTQPDLADRRRAVYGNTEELDPVGSAGHPETPAEVAVDGFEGQDINIAVIDSGVDWRHPMFGGIGQETPLPRVSGLPASASDNTKVIYYYVLGSPGDPTDDFGHGTLVASNSSGFRVDGDTPQYPGFGVGPNGMGAGPTPNGETLHGTAPQSRVMSYKVCGPAPQCPGDIALSIEDAASPFTLVMLDDSGPVPVAKPVADIINLSLGNTAGDGNGATSVAVNNAVLAGATAVIAAGNSGPGPGTVGAPASAVMGVSVAAIIDPGSLPALDVVAAGSIPGENGEGEAPPPLTGADADALPPQPGERQAIKIFPVAGGGLIPDDAVAAHYVFVDQLTVGNMTPEEVTGRVALVSFMGPFAAAANQVAPLEPAAILLITTVESATAVQVINGIPTYTIGPDDAEYLLERLDPESTEPPAHGEVSTLPLRLSAATPLDSFVGSMAGFSSRGPNDHPTANYRVVKNDVAAPGVGIAGAATVEGLPDATVGLANQDGYTQANGTSFASPITAGAMALVRQRVRTELGYDATDPSDPEYRARRYEASVIARALLQNTATDLRSGRGAPPAETPPPTTVNDIGSGMINVADALRANAVLLAPALLLADAGNGNPEFSNRPAIADLVDANGNLPVELPTLSFGNLPATGVDGTLVKTGSVMLREIARGAGAGSYRVEVVNNRLIDGERIRATLRVDGAPVETVSVPADGQVVMELQLEIDGRAVPVSGAEIMGYVRATPADGGPALRLPFYARTIEPAFSALAAPELDPPQGVDGEEDGCGIDEVDGFSLQYRYPLPAGGEPLAGFRIQEATRQEALLTDDASEPLVAGANSLWEGSPQWISAVNPETGNLAYYVPDLVEQNESLTLATPVELPPGGATLAFDVNQSTEADFDFFHVDVAGADGNFQTVATFSGVFVGERALDLRQFAGQPVLIRFRMSSDLLISDVGVFVENIRLISDDFERLEDVGPEVTERLLDRPRGKRFYRVAGLFDADFGNVAGPYSRTVCVDVRRAGPSTLAEGVALRDGSGALGQAALGLLALAALGAAWRRRRA
jgi:subtilisin family serine protease